MNQRPPRCGDRDAAAAYAAVTAGLIEPPDLEAAVSDLSNTLGTWTSALVAT